MENSAKILICDENDEERARLIENLRKVGIRRCDEAKDGACALDMISKYTYDVVIVDLWVSKLDGIGLMKNTKGINFGSDHAPSFIIASRPLHSSIFSP